MAQPINSQSGPQLTQNSRYEATVRHHPNTQSRKETISTVEELKLEQKSNRQRRTINNSQRRILIIKPKHQFFHYYSAGIGIDHHGMQILASVRWEKLKKLCIDWNK